MNDVTHAPVLQRLELTCLYCGHSCGDVRVRSAGRPTYRDIRTAMLATPTASPPMWDAHGAPRCPRCRGKLFIEERERRFDAAAR